MLTFHEQREEGGLLIKKFIDQQEATLRVQRGFIYGVIITYFN
ncbi:hypothetical protein ACGTN9_04745 [Halobacillus sp. MO56]